MESHRSLAIEGDAVNYYLCALGEPKVQQIDIIYDKMWYGLYE